MTDTLFQLPEIPTVPVRNEVAGYPVGRIFCVGRVVVPGSYKLSIAS